MAMEAWARFSTASPNFVHICDSHMQASAIAMADSKDAILFFSYSGSTRDMCDTLQIASSRHVPVILITHFPKSAGAEFASVVLQCGYNAKSSTVRFSCSQSRATVFDRLPILWILQSKT